MQLSRLVSVVIVLLALALPSRGTAAQELLCDVQVNYSQVSGTDYAYLADLEDEIEDYLNDRRWTDDRFEPNERILCSMNVVIQEAVSLTEFEGRLVLTSFRPIYGTAQNTRVMQINDSEWRFEYSQGRPLTFDLETYDSLTSVLDYYAFLILGYDYDSFSELGGTPHFTRARRIAEIARRSDDPGWGGIGASRTRSELVTELLDPEMRPLRRAYFGYHFSGLDHFIDEPEEAQESVLEVLDELQDLAQDASRRYALDLFFDTKYRELVSVFEDSNYGSQAYSLLMSADPSNSSEYRRLTQ